MNGPDWRARRLPQYRLTYVVWVLVLLGIWAYGLWFVSLRNDQGQSALSAAERIDEMVAVSMVLCVVSLLSFVPVFLVLGFLSSERRRAFEDAELEVSHHGWDQRFLEEIADWHKRVFDDQRYPLPVTLALVTFSVGWVFVFLSPGPASIEAFATEGSLHRLLESVLAGPALAFGFLGAYFFSVSMLGRRYIGGDLGPNAFVHVATRTWSVAILVLVLDAVFGGTADDGFGRNVLIAVAFVAGVTPTVVYDVIAKSAASAVGPTLGIEGKSKPLTELEGMNAWRAARLTEEGVDNVHNLANEDPTRLLVVTRQGGLRILDWVDQACLIAAAPDKLRTELDDFGVRTSQDLYRAFDAEGAIEEHEPGRFEVAVPAEGTLGKADPRLARNVLLTIVGSPNFERIRSMRRLAMDAAVDLRSLVMEAPEPTGEAAPDESDRDISMLESLAEMPTGTYFVAQQGRFVGLAAAIAGGHAVTALDVAKVGTLEMNRVGWDSAHGAEIVATDLGSRLALLKVHESGSEAMPLAESDPTVGQVVRRASAFSGLQNGVMRERVAKLRMLVAGNQYAELTDMLRIDVPSRFGDSGAPIVDEASRLAGVLIGGNENYTVAAPASAISALLEVVEGASGD